MQPDRSPYTFIEPRDDIRDIRRWMSAKTQRLILHWTEDYHANNPGAHILLVALGEFRYLYDRAQQRLIAAFGIVAEHHREKRDAGRQKGHPKSCIESDAKGHAIAHSMGGGFDINIFAQDARLNRTEFRTLERLCLDLAPSFYFVRLSYGLAGARPSLIEQGLLANDPEPPRLKLNLFVN